MSLPLLLPEWPAPSRVRSAVTTRLGGVSATPYDSLNLGDHVGDRPGAVADNRALLRTATPAEPFWLRQVHGIRCLDLDTCRIDDREADASVTRRPATVCAILTADCLPVLFCDEAGSVVAAAHAGWRGLLDGVLENTVAAMRVGPRQLLAWLGPAIGPQAFEVGDEVRTAFIAHNPRAALAFRPHAERPGKWWCDIYALAWQRLHAIGLERVYGGGLCTVSDPKRFYSYRRDGVTGRMASLIWLDACV